MRCFPTLEACACSGGIGIATGIIGIETQLDRSTEPSQIFLARSLGVQLDDENGADDALSLTGRYTSLPERARACVDALFTLIPNAALDREGVRMPLKIEGSSPSETVYLYNDTICRGGEDAERLLIEAAEKIEANLQ